MGPGMVLVWVALALPALAAGDRDIPGVDRAPLLALLGDVSRRGNAPAAERCLAALARLGMSADDLAARRVEVANWLADAQPRDPAAMAKKVADLVAAYTAVLPRLERADREALARVILMFDADARLARQALGHVSRDGVWVAPGMESMFAQREHIHSAMQQSRRLAVPVVVHSLRRGLIDHDEAVAGGRVQAGQVTVRSRTLTPGQLERILVAGLRAAAVSRYLLTGALAVPVLAEPLEIEVVEDHASYLAAVEAALAVGLDDAEHLRARRDWTLFHDPRGFFVAECPLEAHAAAVVLRQVWFAMQEGLSVRDPLPALAKGHMNWVCLAMLGTEVPDWGDGTATEQQALADEADTRTAGLSGRLAFLAELVWSDQDPPMASVLMAVAGRVDGARLAKATFVAACLHERGTLLQALLSTAGGRTQPADLEAGLGQGLAEFEADWREWLLAAVPEVDLLELLRVPHDKAGVALLAALAEVRARAGIDGPPLQLDVALSRGCELHGRYLDAHRDQLLAWPDIHEEYPDRPGFSAAGSLAGAMALIAPGVPDGVKALDRYLATFYHRLPLLDPGLRRIGMATVADLSLLDASSMVVPIEKQRVVVLWPPDGATRIPRRMVAELPHPLPELAKRDLGYPITLQLFGDYARPADIRMRLLLGDREVPCRYSSPDAPSNPQRVPDGVYALLPEAPLRGNTRYRVAVSGFGGRLQMDTTFTTGS